MTEALKPSWEADFPLAEDRPFRLTGGGELQPVTRVCPVRRDQPAAR